MQTQVLGTVFDVKAYRKDAPKVTLMEGKVKVSNADTEVEMRPGQTATLQADKIVVSKASSSASDWLEGDFDMDQVTLAEAMSDIGAWYNKPWSSNPRRTWISSSTSASPAGQACRKSSRR